MRADIKKDNSRMAAGQKARRWLARGPALLAAAAVLLFLGAANPSSSSTPGDGSPPAEEGASVDANAAASGEPEAAQPAEQNTREHMPAEANAPAESDAPRPARTVDLEARRQRVRSMSPDRYEHVLHNRERLDDLSPAEQTKLRKLSRDLEVAGDSEALRHVMIRYHDWLRNLSLPQRSELLDLPPKQRLAKIKAIRAEQQARIQAETTAGEPLSAADMALVLKWFSGYLDSHLGQLLAAVPPERRRLIEQMDVAKRRKAMLYLLAPRNATARAALASLPPPKPAEIDRLADALSPGARTSLREAGPLPEQSKLLRRWAQAAVRHRWEEARLERPMSALAVEELQQFFETGLTPQKREELLNLPPDKLQRELRRLFFLQPSHADPTFSIEPGVHDDESPESPPVHGGESKPAKGRKGGPNHRGKDKAKDKDKTL